MPQRKPVMRCLEDDPARLAVSPVCNAFYTVSSVSFLADADKQGQVTALTFAPTSATPHLRSTHILRSRRGIKALLRSRLLVTTRSILACSGLVVDRHIRINMATQAPARVASLPCHTKRPAVVGGQPLPLNEITELCR